MQKFTPNIITRCSAHSFFRANMNTCSKAFRSLHIIRPRFQTQQPITNVPTTASTTTTASPNVDAMQEKQDGEDHKHKKRIERLRRFFDAVEKYKYVTSVILLSCLTTVGMLLYWLDERFFKHVGDKSSGIFRGVSRSYPRKSVKHREDEEKRLKDRIFEMESRSILVVVGAQNCGKSTVIENVLDNDYDFRTCHIKMAQINDTKSFAESIRQALSASESVERFLLNTIFTKREELAKQHQMSNADPLTMTLKEFAENVSNPSHIINIDLLQSSNPDRQTVLFIDDFDTLIPVLNGSEDKELRSKLIALFQIVGRAHGIKMVLCSSSGEVNKLIAAGKAEDMVQYHYIDGLHDINQAEEFFKFFTQTRKPNTDDTTLEKLFELAYPIIRGNIVDWQHLAHNPTEKELKQMQQEMNEQIKIIKSRKMPKRGLFDAPQWTDVHVKVIFDALVKSCRDGNPCGGFVDSSSAGVSAFDLEKKAGVPWNALESLCHYGVLCYNPITHRITFSSALMEYQALHHRELWK